MITHTEKFHTLKRRMGTTGSLATQPSTYTSAAAVTPAMTKSAMMAALSHAYVDPPHVTARHRQHTLTTTRTMPAQSTVPTSSRSSPSAAAGAPAAALTIMWVRPIVCGTYAHMMKLHTAPMGTLIQKHQRQPGPSVM